MRTVYIATLLLYMGLPDVMHIKLPLKHILTSGEVPWDSSGAC